MTISSALSNALSGLRANGKLAEITSNNLANALTPGFGRQSVTLSGSVTAGAGTGVAVPRVERALDPELTAARRIADGNLAERGEMLDGIARLERALGTVEDRGSLANRLQGFETALRSLAETPESQPRQAEAAEAARDLADKMTMISTERTRVRQSADAEIQRRVEDVNRALERIARLNRQIQIFDSAGRETAAMIDERERLVDTVAQNIPIRTGNRPDGQIEIRTAEGLPLADVTARRLVFTPGSGDGLELTPPPVGAPPGVAGRDVTPGGAGAQRIQGGALAGIFALRDRIVPEFEARIDSLAADLLVRGVAAGQDGAAAGIEPGFDPDTMPGIFVDARSASGVFDPDGDGVFDPAPAASDIAGLARHIRLNPNIDPARVSTIDPPANGAPFRLRDGINTLAPSAAVANPALPRALLDRLTESRAALGGAGFGGAASLAGRVAEAAELTATLRVGTEAEVSTLGSTRDSLANEEAGSIGVNSDIELQRLIQIEQAFAANAQVIEAASRMLDELTRIR